MSRRLLLPRTLRALLAVIAALALLHPVTPRAEDETILEPSVEETLLLELANRARADPPRDGELNVHRAKEHGWEKHVDVAMYQREMNRLSPAAPLVFDLKLLRSARNHSLYNRRRNKSGHDETPGTKLFTGQRFTDRARACGFLGRGTGENVSMGRGSAAEIHVAFSIDGVDGDEVGPGNMETGRGHRRSIHDVQANVCGFGLVPGKHGFWTTQAFARVPDKRFAGGVAYIDRNANDFYDAGEGVAGVAIRAVSGTSTKTWASGAYALELKMDAEVELEAAFEGATWRHSATGSGNVKFDVVLLPADLVQRVDDLLARVEQAAAEAKAPPALRAALLELHVLTRERALDDTRASRVASLTAEVSRQLEADRAVVPDLLEERAYPKAYVAARRLLRDYRGTAVAPYFEDALIYAQVLKRWGAMSDRGEELSASSRRKARIALAALGPKLTTEAWSQRLAARLARLP